MHRLKQKRTKRIEPDSSTYNLLSQSVSSCFSPQILPVLFFRIFHLCTFQNRELSFCFNCYNFQLLPLFLSHTVQAKQSTHFLLIEKFTLDNIEIQSSTFHDDSRLAFKQPHESVVFVDQYGSCDFHHHQNTYSNNEICNGHFGKQDIIYQISNNQTENQIESGAFADGTLS